MTLHNKLLSCWHQLEHFHPASIQVTNTTIDLNNAPDIDGIYEEEVNYKQSEVVIYSVYFGVCLKTQIHDHIFRLFQTKNTNPNISQETIYQASFKIDSSGRYIPNTFGVSTFPWAVKQLEQNNIQSQNWGAAFHECQEGLFKKIQPVLRVITEYENEDKSITQETQGRVLKQEDLEYIQKLVIKELNGSFRGNMSVYIEKGTRKLSTREQKNEYIEAYPDVFNSFYTLDLEEIQSNLRLESQNTIADTAFKKYLNGNLNQFNERYDLNKDTNILKQSLHAKAFPDACWPSPYALNLMQQFSVNRIVKQAKEDDKSHNILSVNGPPGTGKTTLLRHAIAGILTERAKKLVTLKDPKDAFETSLSIGNEHGKTTKIARLKKEFACGGIVIASSNNGAVENISKELPLLKEVIPYETETKYLSWIAQNTPNETGEIHWGLISAVLGRQRNRKLFEQRYWKSWDGQQTEYKGLYQFFDKTNNHEIIHWEDAKKEFNECLDLVHEEKKRLYKLSSNSETPQEITSKQEVYEKYVIQLETLLQARNEHESSGANDQNYLNIITKKITQLHSKKETLLNDIKTLKEQQSTLHDEVLAIGDNFADDTFWERINTKEVQNSNPWHSKKLHELQVRLFQKALQLQENFLIHVNKEQQYIIDTLDAFFKWSRGAIELSSRETEALWDTFFMVIPVISSTFASFYRMFGKVGAEKLPWLFIDEAGQALPQAAAGAIYRAKNVVIVGDPFQIEPVNTTPLPIIHHFRNSYGFTNKQIHPLLSVQIAADRINPIGTYISGYAKNDIWIGTPLKVHRRCVSPMFEIANHIAYNNSMFMATETPQDIPLMLQTAFYDVKGLVSGKHFCEAQAQVVLQLVNLEIMMHTALPDLYLISPFREVSTKLRQYLLKNLNYSSGIKTQKADRIDLINWLKSHLGTVHTFQGKQAQGVILCLGLDHQSEKAAIWASSKPNILNVAITRAKYRFSVVGDANIWLNKSFFNQLSALPITRMNNTY